MSVCPICVGHCFICNNFKRISLNHGKVLGVNNIHKITVNREIFAPCFFFAVCGLHMYSCCVDFAFCEVGKK
jgi:hypothetical protein